MEKNDEKFIGFDGDWFKKGFFKYPNYISDNFWNKLKPSEQCILNFILRKTIGYRKKDDFIALRQFSKGTGIKSLITVIRGLKKLEEIGFITVEKRGNGKTNKVSLIMKPAYEQLRNSSINSLVQKMTMRRN